MKKKTLKLSFNKETISNLQMTEVMGGDAIITEEGICLDTNLCFTPTLKLCKPTQFCVTVNAPTCGFVCQETINITCGDNCHITL